MDQLVPECVLDWFKKREDRAQMAIMGSNPMVGAVIISWKNIYISGSQNISVCQYPEHWKEMNDQAKWDWCWNQVDFNMADLALSLGLDLYDVQGPFEMAKRGRLIYPDGTVNAQALNVLRDFTTQAPDNKKGRGHGRN